MVLLWDAVEYYDEELEEWVPFTKEVNAAHWLESTEEELDGDERFTFTLTNNAVNRALVAENLSVRLKYDSEIIFTGVLYGVEYDAKHLMCIVYNEVYEILKKRILSDTFPSSTTDVVFAVVCGAAGVTVGTCPSEPIGVKFNRAYCFNAVKFLAYILGKNFWREGNTVNIGVRNRCVLAVPMDEGMGSTVEDKSGFGNNGTISGASWVDGKYGKALSFDGDDYVQISTSNSLNPTGAISIAFWLKATRRIAAENIVNKRHIGTWYKGYWVSLNWACPRITFNDDYNGLDLVSPVEVPYDGVTRVHVTITFSGTVIKIYQNAVETASKTVSGTIIASPSDLYIASQGGTDDFFAGDIDEVLVDSRAWSPEEVAFHYSEKIKDATPRGVDRSKIRKRVIVVGADADGEEITGEAGDGADTVVFREPKATDVATLNALAAQKLVEVNLPDSRIKLKLFTKYCALLLPGDIISVHNDALALNGMYRIQNIEKGLKIITCEIGRKIKTQDELLKELREYEGMGITVSPEIYPSANVRHSNDTERYTSEEYSWTKLKQIKVDQDIKGTLRIYFDAKAVPKYESGIAEFAVYKNGAKVSDLYYVDTSTYQTFNYDIGNLSANDLLQIYAITNVPAFEAYQYVRNMRLAYDPEVPAYTYTNQDP